MVGRTAGGPPGRLAGRRGSGRLSKPVRNEPEVPSWTTNRGWRYIGQYTGSVTRSTWENAS